MKEEDKTTEQKAKANKIIRLRGALAAGTGLLSFPVLDASCTAGCWWYCWPAAGCT